MARGLRDSLASVSRRASTTPDGTRAEPRADVTAPPALDVGGLRRARRRSLPQEITDQLLALIADGPAPEHRLPAERVLAERFGVSRTSLREALSVLSEWRVIVTRGKTKYGVVARAHAQLATRFTDTETERTLLTDPLEARFMLEPAIAARAAERATSEDLDEVERWLTRMEEAAARGESAIAYDSAFHVAIARATGNSTLVQVVRALTEALQDSRLRAYDPSDAAQVGITDHREILDAMRAHDAPRARRTMRKHLTHVEGLLRASLASGAGEP
ncbi:MAG: GntR family transcriptional regulator, transcriptional repressor for pyruvate dehydrogenase complex [bacterium]|nr:GntR family transcriptional regulator, transcriptional repressor for pyruvate dehydrogenase complex [Solirubrobacteraceae bacterium]